MNCPKCNKPIEPNQRFCAGCGMNLQGAAMEVEKTVAANPDELPVPENAPQPAEAPAPWSFAPGSTPEPEAPAEVPAEAPIAPPDPAPMYGQPARPAYEPPAAPAYQPPQNSYEQQYQQYQQPSQFAGTQPAYQQGYNTPVATEQKKGFSPRILIVIIAAVLVVAGMVVGGIFLFRSCTNPARGSYKDALNDVVSLMNAGQYEELIRKYTIDDYTMTETDRQSIALLSGLKYDIRVNEADSKVYAKDSSEYRSAVSRFTSDTARQNQISEIAVVEATVTVSGSVLGQSMNQTNENTIYMARYNGEWKLPGATAFSPY